MTWTYVDPSTSDRDAVRFLVGDTDDTDHLVTDEEIAYALGKHSVVEMAAAMVADAIAASYSRQVDTKNSRLSVSASQRAKAYRELSLDLQAQARAIDPAEPFFGGLTISGNEALSEDSDAVQPYFSAGMDDFPGTDYDDCSDE